MPTTQELDLRVPIVKIFVTAGDPFSFDVDYDDESPLLEATVTTTSGHASVTEYTITQNGNAITLSMTREQTAEIGASSTVYKGGLTLVSNGDYLAKLKLRVYS